MKNDIICKKITILNIILSLNFHLIQASKYKSIHTRISLISVPKPKQSNFYEKDTFTSNSTLYFHFVFS